MLLKNIVTGEELNGTVLTQNHEIFTFRPVKSAIKPVQADLVLKCGEWKSKREHAMEYERRASRKPPQNVLRIKTSTVVACLPVFHSSLKLSYPQAEYITNWIVSEREMEDGGYGRLDVNLIIDFPGESFENVKPWLEDRFSRSLINSFAPVEAKGREKQMDSNFQPGRALVDGQLVPVDTATYQSAVAQLKQALGPCDDLAAAAWYVRYHSDFRRAGLAYSTFMEAFRDSQSEQGYAI